MKGTPLDGLRLAPKERGRKVIRNPRSGVSSDSIKKNFKKVNGSASGREHSVRRHLQTPASFCALRDRCTVSLAQDLPRN
jgi:hypothetical protein